MSLVVGMVLGIVMHMHKDKVAEVVVKIVDKVKSVFAKK